MEDIQIILKDRWRKILKTNKKNKQSLYAWKHITIVLAEQYIAVYSSSYTVNFLLTIVTYANTSCIRFVVVTNFDIDVARGVNW